MITYNWAINSLKKKNIGIFGSVIYSVVWEKTGTDEEGFSGSYKVSTSLDVNNIDPDNFIVYENITPEILIGWIESIENQDNVHNAIQEEIDAQKSQDIQVDEGNMPWEV